MHGPMPSSERKREPACNQLGVPRGRGLRVRMFAYMSRPSANPPPRPTTRHLNADTRVSHAACPHPRRSPRARRRVPSSARPGPPRPSRALSLPDLGSTRRHPATWPLRACWCQGMRQICTKSPPRRHGREMHTLVRSLSLLQAVPVLARPAARGYGLRCWHFATCDKNHQQAAKAQGHKNKRTLGHISIRCTMKAHIPLTGDRPVFLRHPLALVDRGPQEVDKRGEVRATTAFANFSTPTRAPACSILSPGGLSFGEARKRFRLARGQLGRVNSGGGSRLHAGLDLHLRSSGRRQLKYSWRKALLRLISPTCRTWQNLVELAPSWPKSCQIDSKHSQIGVNRTRLVEVARSWPISPRSWRK